MEQEIEDDTLFCEICGKDLNIHEAYKTNGLCEGCWVEERNLEAEFEERT